ncbi:hemolysin III family protein [Ruegeria sp. SCSIO 43209]|uniref:PAQR family membrane homeostasis protein TrhA n=1 Tax=Ruegeria sp. SCSIO 43209 TaxID=2793010 RepID=UPI00147B3A31|nr:hemolysin III family protein [Ruegeria sp. SCSIO 43209]UAB90259.1 hemolysin III family protein [Ruegeria sp. SCSIO 43209]
MWSFAHIRPAYSRAERISDGVVHVLGVSSAVIAAPMLIIMTVFYRSDPAAVLGASIYGITLVLMLTFSALYNMIEHDEWAEFLRRLDHSGIYVKIAGTYTPFLLLSASQPPGLLLGLWSSATLGSVLKMIDPNRFRWFGLALYLLMGWAAVWAGQSMLAELSPLTLTLMIAGGLIYTAGVVFYLLDWLPYHNTIWHVFVLAGSGLFFAAVALRIEMVPSGPM